MLKIDTISTGKRIFNPNQENQREGDGVYDLTIASMTFENVTLRFNDTYLVPDDYRMRPDLIARDTMGDISKLGSLLKVNSISNPFAIDTRFLLLIPNAGDIEYSFQVKNQRDQNKTDVPNNANNFRKIQQNKVFEVSTSRKAFIETQNKSKSPTAMALPPNVLQPGQTAVTVEQQSIILGRDSGGGATRQALL